MWSLWEHHWNNFKISVLIVWLIVRNEWGSWICLQNDYFFVDFMGKIYFIIDCAIVLDCELSYYILWDRLQILTDSECNCAIIAMLIVWLCNSYHVDCAIVTILIVQLCKNLHFDCAIMWKYAFWLCDCVKICNFIVRLCDCAWLCWLCVIVWFTLSQKMRLFFNPTLKLMAPQI